MTNIEKALEATDMDELIEACGGEAEAFTVLKRAVHFQEKSRLQHKNAYLKRQVRVKAMEEELEKRGIKL
jgi:hypothetical protein